MKTTILILMTTVIVWMFLALFFAPLQAEGSNSDREMRELVEANKKQARALERIARTLEEKCQ